MSLRLIRWIRFFFGAVKFLSGDGAHRPYQGSRLNIQVSHLLKMLVKSQSRSDGQLSHGIKAGQIHQAEVATLGNAPLSGRSFESITTNLVNFASGQPIVLKGHHRLCTQASLNKGPAFQADIICRP